MIDLPEATPSRAITYTTDMKSDNSGYTREIEKYEKKTRGGVEGDIPGIILKNDPVIRIHFQDQNYNDIAPEQIVNVDADITNIISDSQNKKHADLKYDYRDGYLVIGPGQIDYAMEDESGEIWSDVSIVVVYVSAGREYTSVTTLTVLDK